MTSVSGKVRVFTINPDSDYPVEYMGIKSVDEDSLDDILVDFEDKEVKIKIEEI